MMNPITIIILTAVASIAFHELGHYTQAYKLGLNPKFRFDKIGFHILYSKPTIDERVQVIVMGVMSGYIPAVALLLINVNLGFIWMLGWSISNIKELHTAYKLSKEVDR